MEQQSDGLSPDRIGEFSVMWSRRLGGYRAATVAYFECRPKQSK